LWIIAGGIWVLRDHNNSIGRLYGDCLQRQMKYFPERPFEQVHSDESQTGINVRVFPALLRGNVDGSDPAGLCSPGEALRSPLVRYSGLAHSSAPPKNRLTVELARREL